MSPNRPTTTIERTDTAGASPQAAGPEWLELFDPHTSRVVYANTVTGQCSWTRPDSSIAARDPNGEWWELVDEETGVPYYYNSTTGATEWDPPDNATVVPFHALLTSSVGRRLSTVVNNRGSTAFTSEQVEGLTRKASRVSLRSADDRPSRKNSYAASGSHHRRKISTASGIITNASSPAISSPPEPVSTVAEVDEQCPSSAVSPRVHSSSPIGSYVPRGESEYRKKTMSIIETKNKLEAGTRASESSEHRAENRHRLSAQRNSQSETALETLKEALASNTANYHNEHNEHDEDNAVTHKGAEDDEEGHDNFDESGPVGSTFMSGHHVDYNVPASANVEFFRTSDSPLRKDNGSRRPRNYSEQPFHKMPGLERMSAMECYPSGAASSVMMHSHRNRSMPSIRGDGMMYGMRAFASTQFASQKRGFLRRKVPLEEMISYTSETITRPLMNLPREMTRDAVRSFQIIQRYMGNFDEEVSSKDKFNNVLWLANVGVRNQAMRDEIFCQLAKQVTGNPSSSAAENGWTLMGVLLYAFRPTQLFFPHLEAFVDSAPISTVTLKRFLNLQLGRVKRTGSRTSELSVEELRLALTVPSRPLVFGGSLGEIMANPELINEATGLPCVLEQLTGLITSLGGDRTEGLFRVPGNGDAVALTRLQIEAGQPDFSGIHDPNVPASLLKEWLRDLADPLIPESMYDECMAKPADRDTVQSVLDRIPDTSLGVIKYLLGFLSNLLHPDVQASTKMDGSNLALVFGPTLLRNPVSDLKDVFANSSGEQTFVLTMIEIFST